MEIVEGVMCARNTNGAAPRRSVRFSILAALAISHDLDSGGSLPSSRRRHLGAQQTTTARERGSKYNSKILKIQAK